MHWGEAITVAIPGENGEMGGRGGLSVEGKGVIKEEHPGSEKAEIVIEHNWARLSIKSTSIKSILYVL